MNTAVPEGNEREFLQDERDLPRRGGGRRADGEPEAHEDRLDHLGLGNRGNDRRSSAAFLASQHIFS
jgi:hypothetical protein